MLRAGLAAAFAFCSVAAASAGDAVSIVRRAITAACSDPDLDAGALEKRMAGARLVSEAAHSTGAAQSWRRRYALPGGAELEIASAIPAAGRDFRVVLSAPSALGSREELLAVAGPDCAIRVGRSLERSSDGRPRALWYLHADLSASGAGELLDAPVPAAPDPGGLAVAQIDSGVNYLLPRIAARLARDADGAALGFDWWDMDRQPFDHEPSRSAFFPQRHGTQTASLLLDEAPHARLIPYRYPRPDMARMEPLVHAAARTGARIVIVPMGSNRREDWVAFERAARAHPEILFVVSAGNDGRDLDRHPVYPAALGLANQLTVSSAEDDGKLAPGSNWGRRSVDLLVPAERVLVTGFDGQRRFVSGSSYAVSRVGALAACLLAERPHWQAAALRAAILARVVAQPGRTWSVHGFLSDPIAGKRGVCAAQAGVQERGHQTLSGADLLAPAGAAPPVAGLLDLNVVTLNGAGWDRSTLHATLRDAGSILAQCGVRLRSASVHDLEAPERLHYFTIDTARSLAAVRRFPRPVVFLLKASRRPVRFDGEAFAPANSAHDPSLTNSVWLMRGARDPAIALAHELVHVLGDDGEHVSLAGNLMRDETSPGSTMLTAEQCSRIVRSGTARRLLSAPD